jgi:Amt family ammonium transporter
MAIGLTAGVICFFAVNLKFKFRYDDSLDVVGIHLVGGIVGSVLLGVFAQSSINSGVPDGLIFGNAGLLFKQIGAVAAVILFSFTTSYVLARVVKAITGLRVDDDVEHNGLDISLHKEQGYVLSE